MGIGGVLLIIGGALSALEGFLKLVKPEARLLQMSMPCGGSLIVVGGGLILKTLEE